MNSKENVLLPFLKGIGSIVPVSFLIRITGQKVILPTYHLISDQQVPHVRNLYFIRSKKLFLEDLEFLLRHYAPISIEELLDWKRGNKPLAKPSFFLSFDDGLREVKEVIAPILVKKGIPAAFFVNPDFVDNKELMFRNKASLLIDLFRKGKINLKKTAEETGIREDHFVLKVKSVTYKERALLDRLAEVSGFSFSEYLKIQRPYLETEELLELKQQGFHIGAHSMDHPLYEQIPLEEQIAQTAESVRYVGEKGFSGVKTFAFPFTDHGVPAALFHQMYGAMKLDGSFGVAGIKHEQFDFHFHRIPMEKSLASARHIIATEYLYYILKSTLWK
jgi:peptidoglycan/xylan/chitin deacetylase (PgdA/CDA1 family)